MITQSLPKKILIVDDDKEDFTIIRDYIKDIPDHQFIIDWCYRYDEALTFICESSHDLYFIDYLLGVQTGLELIQDIKIKNCEKPVILLTGLDKRDLGIEAVRSGALDYLVENVIPPVIPGKECSAPR